MGRLRERVRVTPAWQFELLLWGISSGFPLSGCFDLPGSQSVFDISEDPPMCVHASLSQDGFYPKGLWVDHPLTSPPFDLQGAFLCMCGPGGLLTSRMREMWPGQGPASCLNCPALLVLESQFTGNESPIALPWQGGGGWGGIYLPPASS